MKTACSVCRRPVWYRARQTKVKSRRVFRQRHGDKDHDLCDRCFRAQCHRWEVTTQSTHTIERATS